jgi:flavin-dependent dehydrogenase
MEKVDVVIVGGGIAGLSVAVAICSESNLAVMLVEKRGVGSNHVTPTVFSEAINEFGLADSVLRNYTAYVFHSPLGAIARFDYQHAALASLDYEKACTILFEQAVSDGLELLAAKAVNWSPAVPDPTRPLVIHLDNGKSIQTEVLIDATGHVQWAAKHLKIGLSRYYSHCFGELLKNCSVEEGSSFRLLTNNSRYGNGGGWFYPTGENSVSMGYSVIVPESQTDRTQLRAGYWAAKQEFQPYADWVKEGVRQRIESGIIPIGRIGRFVADRILIVGDAAGQAHPWVVEGCRPNLYNGRLCAQVVLHAFKKKRFDRSMLASYERKWSGSNRERFWRTASVAELNLARSDQNWDWVVAATQRLSPEQQLRELRDNPASVFQQAYAVAGYVRRQFAKWVRERRS